MMLAGGGFIDLCCCLSGVRQRSEGKHGWTEEEREDKRKEQDQDQQGSVGTSVNMMTDRHFEGLLTTLTSHRSHDINQHSCIH